MSASLYDDPSIYDILHAPGTAAEVDGLEVIQRRFVRAGSASSTWLEPACGTARHLRVAARRGRRVVGFDRSEAMIAYARRRLAFAARVRLSVADMTAFVDQGACRRARTGLAFNLINSIRHLPGDHEMLSHFEQIAAALAPGGIYAVGLSTACYGVEQPSEDVWTGVRGRCRVTQIVQYEPAAAAERAERVASHLVIDRPSGTDHRDSFYTLRSYSLAQWLELVDRSALRLEAVCDELGGDADPAELGYRLYLLRPV